MVKYESCPLVYFDSSPSYSLISYSNINNGLNSSPNIARLTWGEGVSEQGWYDEELESLIWNMGGTFGNYAGEEKNLWGFGGEA